MPPTTLLRAALRSPSAWVAAGATVALGPALDTVARSGALAQRDQADLVWLEDVIWLAVVTSLAGTLAWLDRSQGLRWSTASWRAWSNDLRTLAGMGVLGASLAALVPSLIHRQAPDIQTVRMVVHLCAFAAICATWSRGWWAFVGLATLGPGLASLAPAGLQDLTTAILDPRASSSPGWWIVGALLLASSRRCSTWNTSGSSGP